MTTHTPGPWEAVTFDDEYGHVIIGPSGDERIAVVNGNVSADEADANACLIAAAPALLAALESFVVNVDAGSLIINPEDRRETEWDVANARAAIRQARGETTG